MSTNSTHDESGQPKAAGEPDLRYGVADHHDYAPHISHDNPGQTIENVLEATKRFDQDTTAVERLLAQLSPDSKLAKKANVPIVAHESRLFLVRDANGRIRGMATISRVFTLHGVIGYIEDVVVDEALRGMGVGEKLMAEIIQFAKYYEIDRLKLTSKPERVAANALYKKLGFKLRETNCYSLTL